MWSLVNLLLVVEYKSFNLVCEKYIPEIICIKYYTFTFLTFFYEVVKCLWFRFVCLSVHAQALGNVLRMPLNTYVLFRLIISCVLGHTEELICSLAYGQNFLKCILMLLCNTKDNIIKTNMIFLGAQKCVAYCKELILCV